MTGVHGFGLTRERLWLALAMAALAVVFLGNFNSTAVFHDDAFISFRYAANFAHGKGLVYNPGERAEGYTNPLYVLTAAAMIKAGIPPMVGMVWLCVAAGLLVLPVTYAFGRLIASKSRGAWVFLIAPLLIAANATFTRWSTSGLETTPFALLVLVSLYRYLLERRDQRRLPLAGFLFAACYLTRPDGAIFLVAATLHAVLFPRIARSRAELLGRARAVAPLVLPFVAIVAAHLAWRRVYYHAWLPNTFYAKTGGRADYLILGLEYLRGYLKTGGGYVFYLAPILYLLASGLGAGAGLLLLSVVLYTPFVVAVGGDYMEHYRLFVPLTPLLALMWQEGFGRVWQRHLRPRFAVAGQRAAAFGLTGLLAVGIAAALLMNNDGYPITLTFRSPQDWVRFSWPCFKGVVRGQPFWLEAEAQQPYTRIGFWLKEHCPKSTEVAVIPAGRISYYSGLRILDMLGLNDRHIARAKTPVKVGKIGHEKYDSAYVLSRRPEIILGHPPVAGFTCSDPEDMISHIRQISVPMDDLLAQPGFWQAYRLVVVRVAKGQISVLMFVRRDVQLPADTIELEWAPGS